MSNSEKPIYPISGKDGMPFLNSESSVNYLKYGMIGLTKREHIAIEITKAMLSNSSLVRELKTTDEITTICEGALLCTDELLKQLKEQAK
jgi:hypothetical protein